MNEPFQPNQIHFDKSATAAASLPTAYPPRDRDPGNDDQWAEIANDFFVAANTIYLNHGSFGIPAKQVRYMQRKISGEIHENPMDFFLVQTEGLLKQALARLADFLGAAHGNLAFVDNATYGMSLIAEQFPLNAGDEILLTDHEYVPVTRMWQRRCEKVGANLVIADLPNPIHSDDEIISALTKKITDQTKLLVISHITSPTALILPIESICQVFAAAQISVCIDGPHAPAQVDLQLGKLNCDFYVASCHKWLGAPLGTGFVYTHPRWQESIKPFVKGWGRLPPAEVSAWDEQFYWLGTRDLSHYLAIPTAIEYLTQIGLKQFRQRSYWLASYAESALTELLGTQPIARRSNGHYGSMAHVPLPPGNWTELQRALKRELGIEVMINQFAGRWFLRVSCHLYNNTAQIDLLVKSLKRMGIAATVR